MSSASRLLTALAPGARLRPLLRFYRSSFFALLTEQPVPQVLELGILVVISFRELGVLFL